MTNYCFPKGAAIVFGGTNEISSGIATLLGQCGVNLAFNYMNNEKEAQTLTKGLKSKYGVQVLPRELDIHNDQHVGSFVNKVGREFGRIHSIFFAPNPLQTQTSCIKSKPSHFCYANLQNFFHITKAAIPWLRQGGGGSFTTLTATAADLRNQSSSANPADVSEQALQQMCTSLAKEHGSYAIRANSVGVDISRDDLFTDQAIPIVWKSNLPHFQHHDRQTSQELCESAVFLASENAGYISGQNISFNGNYLL